jgi:glutamate formiminotransferase
MARLVECVPNFSEGRDSAVVDAIAARVSGTTGAYLLDRTSDPDHNRSVLTFAGESSAVTEAMEAALAEAIARIDMRRHEGQHPRLGAVDVIPFVPLGDTSMEECVSLATDFGAHVAERYGLPVYLYARAARRPAREVLSDIRRPQFEGLPEVIATPDYTPDFGLARVHPTAGAVVVGARPFLIAYNINLESRDVGLAREIAKLVRERTGGLPRVQALGLYLDDLACAQVSMNLLDFTDTPFGRVGDAGRAAALERGVALRESELIGLAPMRALTDVADHIGVEPSIDDEQRITRAAEWLAIRDFDPSMALEIRLAQAEREASS